MFQRIKKYILGKGLGEETLRYIVFGVLTTLVNFGLFVFMYELCGIDYNISNITSISASILFAYITNKLIVFRWHCDSRKALLLEFIKFVGARLFTLALEFYGLRLFVEVLNWNATFGKVVLMVLVVILNYIFSKLFVFKR